MVICLTAILGIVFLGLGIYNTTIEIKRKKW